MAPPDDNELRALAAAAGDRLQAGGRSLVTAESCTGGWIAKVCTELAGSSRWFRGGVVAYANSAKAAVLGVDPRLLEADGAVSESTVRAMAVGALERLGGEVSVAVSGIAGPEGASPGKPVGTVWMAWATRGEEGIGVTALCAHFTGDRDAVRRQAVRQALLGVLEAP